MKQNHAAGNYDIKLLLNIIKRLIFNILKHFHWHILMHGTKSCLTKRQQ